MNFIIFVYFSVKHTIDQITNLKLSIGKLKKQNKSKRNKQKTGKQSKHSKKLTCVVYEDYTEHYYSVNKEKTCQFGKLSPNTNECSRESLELT